MSSRKSETPVPPSPQHKLPTPVEPKSVTKKSSAPKQDYYDRYDNYDDYGDYEDYDDDAIEGELDEEYWQYQDDIKLAAEEAKRVAALRKLPVDKRIKNPMLDPEPQTPEKTDEMVYHPRIKANGQRSTATPTPPPERGYNSYDDDYDDWEGEYDDYYDDFYGEGEYDDWFGEGEFFDDDDYDDDDDESAYGSDGYYDPELDPRTRSESDQE